jgi:hypothetical protein
MIIFKRLNEISFFEYYYIELQMYCLLKNQDRKIIFIAIKIVHHL